MCLIQNYQKANATISTRKFQAPNIDAQTFDHVIRVYTARMCFVTNSNPIGVLSG